MYDGWLITAAGTLVNHEGRAVCVGGGGGLSWHPTAPQSHAAAALLILGVATCHHTPSLALSDPSLT